MLNLLPICYGEVEKSCFHIDFSCLHSRPGSAGYWCIARKPQDARGFQRVAISKIESLLVPLRLQPRNDKDRLHKSIQEINATFSGSMKHILILTNSSPPEV